MKAHLSRSATRSSRFPGAIAALLLLLTAAPGHAEEPPPDEDATAAPPAAAPSAALSADVPRAPVPPAAPSPKVAAAAAAPTTAEGPEADAIWGGWRFAVGARIPPFANTGMFSPDLRFEASPLRWLWLTARAGGSVDVTSTHGVLLPSWQQGMSASTGAFAAVGARWVVNPDHRVQGFLSVEGQTGAGLQDTAWYSLGDEPIPLTARSAHLQVSLGGGLEARVFDELFLRVSSDVVTVGAGVSEQSWEAFALPLAPDAALSSTGAYLRTHLLPSVAVFYRF